LRRQVAVFVFEPGGRVLLSALARVLGRDRWSILSCPSGDKPQVASTARSESLDVPAVVSHHEVPGGLRGPSPRGVLGDSAEVHASRVEFDEEQDVVAAEQDRIDGDEGTGDDPAACDESVRRFGRVGVPGIGPARVTDPRPRADFVQARRGPARMLLVRALCSSVGSEVLEPDRERHELHVALDGRFGLGYQSVIAPVALTQTLALALPPTVAEPVVSAVTLPVACYSPEPAGHAVPFCATDSVTVVDWPLTHLIVPPLASDVAGIAIDALPVLPVQPARVTVDENVAVRARTLHALRRRRRRTRHCRDSEQSNERRLEHLFRPQSGCRPDPTPRRSGP
jgi:hypothetical protein